MNRSARGSSGLGSILAGSETVYTVLKLLGGAYLAVLGVRTWLGRSPRRLERLSAGGGLTMILLGAGLALSGRRG